MATVSAFRPTRRWRVAAAMLVAAPMLAAACSGDDDSTPSTTATTVPDTVVPTVPDSTPPDTTAPPTTSPPSPARGLRTPPPFAEFAGVPLLDDSAPYVGLPLPTSLDEVRMGDWIREWLTQTQPELGQMVADQGFAVNGQSGSQVFHSVYQGVAYDYGTIYLTTDTAYHFWHLVFDKVLRDLEQERLAPALAELLVGLVGAARVQATELAGTPLADHAERVVALYEAAAVLLGADVGEVSSRAEDVVTLATDAAEVTTSPITGFEPCQWPNAFEGCVDYTQFRPRGHYTRTPELEAYFRAMSVLGQEAFYVDGLDGLRTGLLATRLVTEDPATLALWRQVYEPTAFMVGVADDYTPEEAAAVADLGDPLSLADDAVVAGIGEALVAARPVAIDPENASLRVMGARLTLDSFVLDQLAWPNVGTDDARRVFVSPLDLASAFGSPLAADIQERSGQREYVNYDEQLAAMRALIDERTTEQWAGTVYDAWLYALEPQFAPRGVAYPEMMRTPAWATKSLQTALSSYTELKHDTLLFAKQGTASEGEGPPVPEYRPYHTVEQDPVAFGRIAAVARLTQEGLGNRNLLTPTGDELLSTIIELTEWWERLARAELRAEVTSEDDLQRLERIGSELEALWFETMEIEPMLGFIPQTDDAAALVADIFRSSFETLYLGTGQVETIFVVVPDPDGRFQLAQGAVSSYHEFWRPAEAPRLTDDEWRLQVERGEQPPRPAWLSPILVGAEISRDDRVVQSVS